MRYSEGGICNDPPDRFLYAQTDAKNVPAWLTLLSALAAGAYGGNFGRPYQHYEYSFEPERLFWVLPIPLILLVITVFRTIRQEYSNGAIRNKIVAGHSKTAVYAAYMSAVLIFSAMTALLCLVPFRMLAVKGLRYLKEMPGKSAERMLMIYLLVFLLTGTLCGLCSLLTSRHSYAVTALMTLSILTLISGLSLSWKLNQPETIRQRTGAGDTEEVPNPDYVTSPERELLSFFSRCNLLCALDAARSSAQSGLSMPDGSGVRIRPGNGRSKNQKAGSIAAFHCIQICRSVPRISGLSVRSAGSGALGRSSCLQTNRHFMKLR